VLLLVVAIGAAGVAITVFAYFEARDLTKPGELEKWDRAFWLEVAKAGVQLVAVAVLGGAAAWAWRARERARDQEAERKAKLRSELAELVALYNDGKNVRRTLRSLGLDAKLHVLHSPRRRRRRWQTELGGGMDLNVKHGLEQKREKKRLRQMKYEGKPSPEKDKKEGPTQEQLDRVGRTVRLTEEQVRGFHEQMQTLNELQLGYEAKKRQFGEAGLLADDDRSKVVKELTFIEGNLNDMVGLWEEYGWMIREGTPLGPVSNWLQDLFRQDEFRPSVSEPMGKITEIINHRLFGAPRKTEATLAREIADSARKADGTASAGVSEVSAP
jgi:hypothetical protein